MSGRTAAVALAVVVALGSGGSAGCGSAGETDRAPRFPAPDFELQNLSGDAVTLLEHAGRPVVIDFWATWCAPCVHQIPILNAFQAAHDDVVVLGVSVDAEGSEVVAAFAKEHGIEYPVLLGDEALARRYGAPGFPAMAIVTPDGHIDQLHVGLVDPDELEASVAEARAAGGAGDGG